MTSPVLVGSANVIPELYCETLDKLGLLEPLQQVPFHIQRRRTAFTPAERCLALLASQARGCARLTDCGTVLRHDSRLTHWLGGRTAPHASTLSRTLKATDIETVRGLRKVLTSLSDQAFLQAEATGPHLFIDIDNKGMPAEGKTYEGTSWGRMSDRRFAKGYRLHVLSIDNRWPLDMELSGAHEHAAAAGMLLIKRLAHRVSGAVRTRTVIRGDSAHGGVRFIRGLARYRFGYLVKGYNRSTSERLLKEEAHGKPVRIRRKGRADLLATEFAQPTLTGQTRKKGKDGKEKRRPCKVTVPRTVVYQEDPQQVAAGKKPEIFCLITTLSRKAYPAAQLLDRYNDRGGDVENIFCQLDQAFSITHLRSRKFYGNYTFLMLTLIAGNLTQMLRERARYDEQPIPAGLSETIEAAATSGLCLTQDEQAGCVLTEPDEPRAYTATFRHLLNCSYQHRLRFAA